MSNDDEKGTIDANNDGSGGNNVDGDVAAANVIAAEGEGKSNSGVEVENTTEGVDKDGANPASGQIGSDGSLSSNAAEADEDTQEQGAAATKDKLSHLFARMHVSNLALFVYFRFGSFWFLDVNNNNVSLEKTGPIQNTLAGNPMDRKLAMADSIDSSVVASVFTRKPVDLGNCDTITDVSNNATLTTH